MTLSSMRDAVQIIASSADAVAALGALWVYRNNSRRERARWAESLYARFYEKPELKIVRDQLDCPAGDMTVSRAINEETSAFTDYLNFFEFVAYLQSSKQLSDTDGQELFVYRLNCLRRHKELLAYVQNKEKWFEYLSKILSMAKVEKVGNQDRKRYLFSYGTLLPRLAPPEIKPTVRRLRHVRHGSIRGRLILETIRKPF